MGADASHREGSCVGSGLMLAFRYGRNILFWASYHGILSCVEALIAAKANVNDSSPSVKFGNANKKDTPLFAAVLNGHAEVAGMLISAGADVNAVST